MGATYHHRSSMMTASSLFDLSGDVSRITLRVEALAKQLYSDDEDTAAKAVTALDALLDEASASREALRVKADAYCWVIEKLRASAAARDSKAAALQKLASTDTRHADALQERLVACLQRVSPEALVFDLPHHRLSSRLSEAVEIDSEAELALWPADCLRTKVEPDKIAAKRLLVNNPDALPGARLMQRRSWRIS